MKYLGIDYGSKRVGIAVADEGGMAFPRAILPNDDQLLPSVVHIITQEKIEIIVMGDSLDRDMHPNPIMKQVHMFADKLRAATSAVIVFHPEHYTSQEAKHLQGDNVAIDSSAAAIILQSYLDKNYPRASVDDEEGI